MRVSSVASIRGNSRIRSLLPSESSSIRFVYDLLYEHRGRQVPLEEWRALKQLVGRRHGSATYRSVGWLVNELQDYWGCDVRDRALVGEWCGRVYVDYTEPAERDARDDQMSRVEREAAAVEAREAARRAA